VVLQMSTAKSPVCRLWSAALLARHDPSLDRAELPSTAPNTRRLTGTIR